MGFNSGFKGLNILLRLRDYTFQIGKTRVLVSLNVPSPAITAFRSWRYFPHHVRIMILNFSENGDQAILLQTIDYVPVCCIS